MSWSLALLLFANPGADAFLAAESVAVEKVAALPPIAGERWRTARALLAAPQRTVALNDQVANAALAAGLEPRPLRVGAVTDGRSLAIVVEWSDATESRPAPDAIDEFGDGVALQLPAEFGPGVRLPYLGMGDRERPVELMLLRAQAVGARLRTAVAAGFGSSTRAERAGASGALSYDAARGGWRAVFVQPLPPGARTGLVPFALAVFDGARHERGGNKATTGWKFARLPGAPDPTYLAELSFGYGPGALGDPARGKAIAQGVCSACHRFADRRFAAVGLAPELSEIGLLASPSYLLQSIVEPSAVIVPHLHLNRHTDRSGPPDANRAFPNQAAFGWSTVDDGGRAVSKMPSFASLPKEDVAAMVAYLLTLGRPSEGSAR